MSRISALSGGSARPFRLRRKQSFTRSSSVTTRPLRLRYCGNRAYTPTRGIAWGTVPSRR